MRKDRNKNCFSFSLIIIALCVFCMILLFYNQNEYLPSFVIAPTLTNAKKCHLFLPQHSSDYDSDKVDKLVSQIMKGLNSLQQNNSIIVSYVRNHHLHPPSPPETPYALKNPNKDNPSQYGQNKVVMNLLKYKRNGIFVEAGALDGETFSNTLWLERFYNWTGLLVEADPVSFAALAKKNRKSWISHTCLSTESYPHLTKFYKDANTNINSLLRNSTTMNEGFGYLPTSAVEVQCIPLYTLLLSLNWTTVDYLSLDVEGADLLVLKTIPFHLVTIKVLEVEANWASHNKSLVRNFLENKGYVFIQAIWPDEIFAHPSIL